MTAAPHGGRVMTTAPKLAAAPSTIADDDSYDPEADFAGSLNVAYAAIRQRALNGGAWWTPRLNFETRPKTRPAETAKPSIGTGKVTAAPPSQPAQQRSIDRAVFRAIAELRLGERSVQEWC
jgi:hypothetical protein